MKKGFSVAALIILIVVLAGLGFGGYYAYNNYIAPMLNPRLAFIPDNLKGYAKGSDADIFVIFKDEEEKISTLLKLAGVPDENNLSMKSGIVILKNSTKCAAAALEFDTNETASKVKTLIEISVADNPDPSLSFKVGQKDTIVTVDVNEGFSGLQGNLSENPLFKNLDLNKLDNQLIIAINNKNIFDISNLLVSPVNFANAQLISEGDTPTNIARAPDTSNDGYPAAVLLYSVENTYIYTKIDGLNINLSVQLKQMDKTTFEESQIFNIIPDAEADEFYKQAEVLFNTEINEQFKNLTSQMPGFTGTSEYKDLTANINVKVNLKEVITMMFSGLSAAIETPSDTFTEETPQTETKVKRKPAASTTESGEI